MRSSFCNFFSCYETQQLIPGTGTAIWWVTEPHCLETFFVLVTDTKPLRTYWNTKNLMPLQLNNLIRQLRSFNFTHLTNNVIEKLGC